MRQTTVAFDIDGTLFNKGGYPNYPVIDLLRILHTLGCRIVVWSGGGMMYAEHMIDRLGIADMVEVWDKSGEAMPDVAVDDTESCTLGTVQIIIPDPLTNRQ